MFSKNNVLRAAKWVGYPMVLLFAVSFIASFFQKIDPVAILGTLFLTIISVGLLYSRSYAFHGSKFWFYYMFGAFSTILLFSFGLLFMGTIATAIFFPFMFYASFFPIVTMFKIGPSCGGSSPHKTLALLRTFIPLAALLVYAWGNALLGKY